MASRRLAISSLLNHAHPANDASPHPPSPSPPPHPPVPSSSAAPLFPSPYDDAFTPTPQPVILAPHLRNSSRGGHLRDIQDNLERESRQYPSNTYPRPPIPPPPPQLQPQPHPHPHSASTSPPYSSSRSGPSSSSPSYSTNSREHSVPFHIQPTPPQRRTPEPDDHPAFFHDRPSSRRYSNEHRPPFQSMRHGLTTSTAASPSPSPPRTHIHPPDPHQSYTIPTAPLPAPPKHHHHPLPLSSSAIAPAYLPPRSRPVSPEILHYHHLPIAESSTPIFRPPSSSAARPRIHSPTNSRSDGSRAPGPVHTALSPLLTNPVAAPPPPSVHAPPTPATPFDALMAAVTIETERMNQERRRSNSAASPVHLDHPLRPPSQSPTILHRHPGIAAPSRDPSQLPPPPRTSLSPVQPTYRLPSYASEERLRADEVPLPPPQPSAPPSSYSRHQKRPRSDSNRAEVEHVRRVSAAHSQSEFRPMQEMDHRKEDEDDGKEVFYAPAMVGTVVGHIPPRSRPGSRTVQERERERTGMRSLQDVKGASSHQQAATTASSQGSLSLSKKMRKKSESLPTDKTNTSSGMDTHHLDSTTAVPNTPDLGLKVESDVKEEVSSSTPFADELNDKRTPQQSAADVDKFFLELCEESSDPHRPTPPPATEPIQSPPRRPPRVYPGDSSHQTPILSQSPGEPSRVLSKGTPQDLEGTETRSPIVSTVLPNRLSALEDEVIAAVEAASEKRDLFAGRAGVEEDMAVDILMKEVVPEEEEEQLEEEEELLKPVGGGNDIVTPNDGTRGLTSDLSATATSLLMDVEVEDELLSLVDGRPASPPVITPASRQPTLTTASRPDSKGGRPSSRMSGSVHPPTLPGQQSHAVVSSPSVSARALSFDRTSMPPPATVEAGKDSTYKKTIEKSGSKKDAVKPSKAKQPARPRPKATTSKAKAARANVAAANPRHSSAASTPPPVGADTGSASLSRSKKSAAKKGTHAALVAAAAAGGHQRSRSASALPDSAAAADGKDDAAEDGEAEDDDKLYCICKTTYDEDRVMIACDRCDEWYHTSCIDIPDTEVDLVDQFFCPRCVANERQLQLKTTYKTRCLRGLRHSDPNSSKACRKASRGAFSKYCSDECGIQSIRSRIDAWATSGGDKDRLWETVKDAERRQGVAIAVQRISISVTSPSSEDVKMEDIQPSNVPATHASEVTVSAKVTSLANLKEQKKRQEQREIARLQAQLDMLVVNRGQRKKEMDTVIWREKLVDLAVQRAEEVDECGWDSRLLYDDEEVEEFGAGALESYDHGAELDDTWWCHGAKKCERHTGWSKLRAAEVMFEKEVKEQALAKLTQRERHIRRRMEDIVNPQQLRAREMLKAPLRVKHVPNVNGQSKIHGKGTAPKKGKKRKAMELG